MKRLIPVIMGLLAAVLLIGSFTVQETLGSTACNIVRVIGYVLMFAAISLSTRMKIR